MKSRFGEIVKELLRRGVTVSFRARGKSMGPTIRDGDTMVVEPLGCRPLRYGDVVLCATERGLVAHRLVGRNGDMFRIQGDAPGSGSEEVSSHAVRGRMRPSRAWVSRLFRWLGPCLLAIGTAQAQMRM